MDRADGAAKGAATWGATFGVSCGVEKRGGEEYGAGVEKWEAGGKRRGAGLEKRGAEKYGAGAEKRGAGAEKRGAGATAPPIEPLLCCAREGAIEAKARMTTKSTPTFFVCMIAAPSAPGYFISPDGLFPGLRWSRSRLGPRRLPAATDAVGDKPPSAPTRSKRIMPNPALRSAYLIGIGKYNVLQPHSGA
jgi:hypothetical protein